MFPDPTKLKAVTTPVVTFVPADWIPILSPPTAVKEPSIVWEDEDLRIASDAWKVSNIWNSRVWR